MNTMARDEAIKALTAAIGADQVLTDEATLRAASVDRWPIIAKWAEEELLARRPLAVARPRSTAEVAAVVTVARDHSVAIVPRGGGSGVTGAAVPDTRSIVLDLTGMNAVIDFSEEDAIVSAHAGLLAGDLETWLNARGYTLGHYPQSLALASLGGLVATGSSGTFSSKYGGIEDLVLGMEVVMSDGNVVRHSVTPRAAVGPQLWRMHIGAEGALGIITEVTLKVFATPERRHFLGYTFPTVSDGLAAVRSGYRRHLVPAVLRLYDEIEARGLYQRVGLEEARPLLIVGHEGVSEVVDAVATSFDTVALAHGGKPLGSEIGAAWERHRYDASWLERGNAGPASIADAIEISGQWSMLEPLFDEITARLRPLTSAVMSHFSHFYTSGGSIYFIVAIEGTSPADARSRYQAVWNAAMESTLRHGGAISHHHGVGLVRDGWVERYLGDAFTVWSRVKDSLDPQRTLVPGKLGL